MRDYELFIEKNIFYPTDIIEFIADFYVADFLRVYHPSPSTDRAWDEVLDFTEDKIYDGLKFYAQREMVWLMFWVSRSCYNMKLLPAHFSDYDEYLKSVKSEDFIVEQLMDIIDSNVPKMTSLPDFDKKIMPALLEYAQYQITMFLEEGGEFYDEEFLQDTRDSLSPLVSLMHRYNTEENNSIEDINDITRRYVNSAILPNIPVEENYAFMASQPWNDSNKKRMLDGVFKFFKAMGTSKSQLAIDHLIDLSHNTGMLLSDMQYGMFSSVVSDSDIQNILDTKRDAREISDLEDMVSRGMRQKLDSIGVL